MPAAIRAVLVLLATATPAVASPTEISAEAPEHHSWLTGVKLAAGAQLGATEKRFGQGVGIFAEKSLVPGWLDLEVVLIAAQVDDEQIVPVDVLAKKPIHFHERIAGYVGLGGSLTLEMAHGEQRLRPGIAAAAGTYLWLNGSWGVDIELDYNYLVDEGGFHELNIAAGPVMRF